MRRHENITDKRRWAEEQAAYYRDVSSNTFGDFELSNVFWINELSTAEFWLNANSHNDEDLLSGPMAIQSEVIELLKYYFASDVVKYAYSVFRETNNNDEDEAENDIKSGQANLLLMIFGNFLLAKVTSSKSYLTARSIIGDIETGCKDYKSHDDERIIQDLKSGEIPYFYLVKE